MIYSKKIKRVLAFVLAVALVVSFTNTPVNAAKKYVKSLSVKSSATVEAGKTVKVKATVKVSAKASAAVKVSSADKAIATVSVGKPSKKGVSTITIKGVKAGSTKITVKTKAKNKKKQIITKKITVTVTGSTASNDDSTKPVETTTTQAKTEATTTTQAVKTISALSVKVSPESLKLAVSTSEKLTADVYPKNSTDPVIWSSSNTKIADVSADGVVTAGAEEGTATITAKAGKYSATCKVTVFVPFTEADYTVEEGNKTVHIDFTATDEATANLYKDWPGFTVTGKHVEGDVDCESYKYTFKRLPETLDDIKKIKLDNPCAPMAATICAIHSVDTTMSSFTFADAKNNTLLPMLNYIGGPACNLMTQGTQLHAQFLADRLFEGRGGSSYLRDCYFDGATPSNGYTPTEPYTFTMYIGPYYIPAQTGITGNRPETYMSLIEFAGDDSQRYIDVYKSSNGNWYALNSSPYETFKQLMAKPKDPSTVIEW